MAEPNKTGFTYCLTQPLHSWVHIQHIPVGMFTRWHFHQEWCQPYLLPTTKYTGSYPQLVDKLVGMIINRKKTNKNVDGRVRFFLKLFLCN